jgi:hypothetical protein
MGYDQLGSISLRGCAAVWFRLHKTTTAYESRVEPNAKNKTNPRPHPLSFSTLLLCGCRTRENLSPDFSRSLQVSPDPETSPGPSHATRVSLVLSFISQRFPGISLFFVPRSFAPLTRHGSLRPSCSNVLLELTVLKIGRARPPKPRRGHSGSTPNRS